jgi:hypothetical protein
MELRQDSPQRTASRGLRQTIRAKSRQPICRLRLAQALPARLKFLNDRIRWKGMPVLLDNPLKRVGFPRSNFRSTRARLTADFRIALVQGLGILSTCPG